MIVPMTIDRSKMMPVKRDKALKYQPRGSYQTILPVDWCKSRNIKHGDQVTFYQILDEPNILIIEFEESDEQ